MFDSMCFSSPTVAKEGTPFNKVADTKEGPLRNSPQRISDVNSATVCAANTMARSRVPGQPHTTMVSATINEINVFLSEFNKSTDMLTRCSSRQPKANHVIEPLCD